MNKKILHFDNNVKQSTLKASAADAFGLTNALLIIAGITAAAGIVAHFRMCCTLKKWWRDADCEITPAY